MKFRTKLQRLEDWEQEKPDWYRWFAWYPVSISNKKMVWLGYVKRHRRLHLRASFDYRFQHKRYDYKEN